VIAAGANHHTAFAGTARETAATWLAGISGSLAGTIATPYDAEFAAIADCAAGELASGNERTRPVGPTIETKSCKIGAQNRRGRGSIAGGSREDESRQRRRHQQLGPQYPVRRRSRAFFAIAHGYTSDRRGTSISPLARGGFMSAQVHPQATRSPAGGVARPYCFGATSSTIVDWAICLM
jgi:hypothetical protein